MPNLLKISTVILLSCYLVSLFFGAFNFALAETTASLSPTLSVEKLPVTEKTNDADKKPESEGVSAGDFGLGAVQGTPKGLLVDMLVNIANWIMGIVGIALVAMLIYGGVTYMFGGVSAGKEKSVQTGKNIITYAIIGIVIIFAAYIIAQFVIKAVTTQAPAAEEKTSAKTDTSGTAVSLTCVKDADCPGGKKCTNDTCQ